ncbi:hypothetical protein QUA70_24565 [Microcoleus sp. LAD1_D5]|uniref:IS1/IS1595 family N-terminal zinc-binding domain-containing protein n=1 Tax=unclassified Microcoleus TaxID=2642155 RepID=UPI002FCFDC2F
MNCPKCNSEYILKNGRTRSQKQNFKCRDCGRQFVMSPRHQPISSATKELIDRGSSVLSMLNLYKNAKEAKLAFQNF